MLEVCKVVLRLVIVGNMCVNIEDNKMLGSWLGRVVEGEVVLVKLVEGFVVCSKKGYN